VTDSIEDSDVRRVDKNVDPTALSTSDLEEELPDDFSKSAKQAFAKRVSSQRQDVRESVDLGNRLASNPANGKTQLRGPNGAFGPMADSVRATELDEDGSFYAQLDPDSNYAQKHGTTRFKVDTVDLNAGADEPRGDNW